MECLVPGSITYPIGKSENLPSVLPVPFVVMMGTEYRFLCLATGHDCSYVSFPSCAFAYSAVLYIATGFAKSKVHLHRCFPKDNMPQRFVICIDTYDIHRNSEYASHYGMSSFVVSRTYLTKLGWHFETRLFDESPYHVRSARFILLGLAINPFE